MKKYLAFETQDGEFDVEEGRMDAFREKYPDARPIRAFDTPDGEFDVTPERMDAFRAKYPEAKELFHYEDDSGEEWDVGEDRVQAFAEAQPSLRMQPGEAAVRKAEADNRAARAHDAAEQDAMRRGEQNRADAEAARSRSRAEAARARAERARGKEAAARPMPSAHPGVNDVSPEQVAKDRHAAGDSWVGAAAQGVADAATDMAGMLPRAFGRAAANRAERLDPSKDVLTYGRVAKDLGADWTIPGKNPDDEVSANDFNALPEGYRDAWRQRLSNAPKVVSDAEKAEAERLRANAAETAERWAKPEWNPEEHTKGQNVAHAIGEGAAEMVPVAAAGALTGGTAVPALWMTARGADANGGDVAKGALGAAPFALPGVRVAGAVKGAVAGAADMAARSAASAVLQGEAPTAGEMLGAAVTGAAFGAAGGYGARKAELRANAAGKATGVWVDVPGPDGKPIVRNGQTVQVNLGRFERAKRDIAARNEEQWVAPGLRRDRAPVSGEGLLRLRGEATGRWQATEPTAALDGPGAGTLALPEPRIGTPAEARVPRAVPEANLAPDTGNLEARPPVEPVPARVPRAVPEANLMPDTGNLEARPPVEPVEARVPRAVPEANLMPDTGNLEARPPVEATGRGQAPEPPAETADGGIVDRMLSRSPIPEGASPVEVDGWRAGALSDLRYFAGNAKTREQYSNVLGAFRRIAEMAPFERDSDGAAPGMFGNVAWDLANSPFATDSERAYLNGFRGAGAVEATGRGQAPEPTAETAPVETEPAGIGETAVRTERYVGSSHYISSTDGMLRRFSDRNAPKQVQVVSAEGAPGGTLAQRMKAQREWILAETKAAAERAPEEGSQAVRFEIPGDGKFTVRNEKKAILDFGKKISAALAPEKSPETGAVRARPDIKVASSAPATFKTADSEKLLSPFVSKDGTRKFLSKPWMMDNGTIVATDGRMVVAVRGVPGARNPKSWSSLRSPEDSKLIDDLMRSIGYGGVFPGEAENPFGRVRIPEAVRDLREMMAGVKDDPHRLVDVFRTEDGGLSFARAEHGVSAVSGNPGEFVSSVNGENLINVLSLMAKAGNSEAVLGKIDPRSISPIRIAGNKGNVHATVMPISGKSPEEASADAAEAYGTPVEATRRGQAPEPTAAPVAGEEPGYYDLEMEGKAPAEEAVAEDPADAEYRYEAPGGGKKEVSLYASIGPGAGAKPKPAKRPSEADDVHTLDVAWVTGLHGRLPKVDPKIGITTAQEQVVRDIVAEAEERALYGTAAAIRRQYFGEDVASPATTGGFAEAVASSPGARTVFSEIGQILREMSAADAFPELRRSIHRGLASGVFRALPGDSSSGSVGILRSLFSIVGREEDLALREKAIRTAEQRMFGAPRKMIRAEAERLYGLFYEDAFQRNFQNGPVEAMQTAAHELGHWLDFLEDGEFARGNLLGHMAGLKHFIFSKLAAQPGAVEPKKSELDRVRRAAAAKVKRDPGETDEVFEARKRQAARLAVSEELAKRAFIGNPVLSREVDRLVAWMHANDHAPAYYRNDPAEAFAEAFSAWLLFPGKTDELAPTFSAAIDAFAQSRPDAWKAIRGNGFGIRFAKPGTEAAAREAADDRIFGRVVDKMKGQNRAAAMAERVGPESPFRQTGVRKFMDKLGTIVGEADPYIERGILISRGNGRNSQWDDPYFQGVMDAMNRKQHWQNIQDLFSKDMRRAVYKPIEGAGVSRDDFDALFLLRRMGWERLGEHGERGRVNMANPEALDPATARGIYDRRMSRLDPAARATVEKAFQDLWGLWKGVIDTVYRSGEISDGQYQALVGNDVYASFSYAKAKPLAPNAKRGGMSDYTGIMRQVMGTFEVSRSPTQAMEALAGTLVRQATMNDLRRKAVAFLAKHFPDEVRMIPRGDSRWKFDRENKRWEVEQLKGYDVETVIWKEAGIEMAADVPTDLAYALENAFEPKTTGLGRRVDDAVRAVNGIEAMMLTLFNLKFQFNNMLFYDPQAHAAQGYGRDLAGLRGGARIGAALENLFGNLRVSYGKMPEMRRIGKAWRTGNVTPMMREAIDAGLLPAGNRAHGAADDMREREVRALFDAVENGSDREALRVLDRLGLAEAAKAEARRNRTTLRRILNSVEDTATRIGEAIPLFQDMEAGRKFYQYERLRKLHPTWPRSRIAFEANKMTSTPDSRNQGRASRNLFASSAFIFLQPVLRSFKDQVVYRIQSDPKTQAARLVSQFGWKKLFQFGAKQWFGGALALGGIGGLRALFLETADDERKKGNADRARSIERTVDYFDRMHEAQERIPIRNRLNGITIPIDLTFMGMFPGEPFGFPGGEKNKTLFLYFPHEQRVASLFAPAFWALDALESQRPEEGAVADAGKAEMMRKRMEIGVEDVLDTSLGAFPNFSPLANVAWGLTRGSNPGRSYAPIVPKKEQGLGVGTRAKRYAEFVWDSFGRGAGMLPSSTIEDMAGWFTGGKDGKKGPGAPEKTKLEKSLSLPGLVAVWGNYLRVADGSGNVRRMNEYEKARTARSMQLKAAFIDAIQNQDYAAAKTFAEHLGKEDPNAARGIESMMKSGAVTDPFERSMGSKPKALRPAYETWFGFGLPSGARPALSPDNARAPRVYPNP